MASQASGGKLYQRVQFLHRWSPAVSRFVSDLRSWSRRLILGSLSDKLTVSMVSMYDRQAVAPLEPRPPALYPPVPVPIGLVFFSTA